MITDDAYSSYNNEFWTSSQNHEKTFEVPEIASSSYSAMV